MFSNLQAHSGSTSVPKLLSWAGHSHGPKPEQSPHEHPHISLQGSCGRQLCRDGWACPELLGNQITAQEKAIRVHSHLQEAQWESYPPFLGQKRETEILQQLKSKDFCGGVRHKVMVPTVGHTALRPSQETSFFSYVCFLQTPELRGSPGITGCYQSKKKATYFFLVHSLWKHKSAIRSYKIFLLFIINIVPEAVTWRRKRYERISSYFDN